MLLYSNIIIHFLPPILSEQGEPLEDPRYVIRINSPASNRRGVEQHLPQTIFLPISTIEPLKLKLVPSSTYRPLRRYEITYFEKGNTVPIHEERWIVPEPLRGSREKITASGAGEVSLWPEVYAVESVSWQGVWQVINQRLVWVENAPPKGTEYDITFARGFTLDQLIDR